MFYTAGPLWHHFFISRYRTDNTGFVDQFYFKIIKIGLQQNLAKRPYTDCVPIVQWDIWLDEGRSKRPPPSNQFFRYRGRLNSLPRQSMVAVQSFRRHPINFIADSLQKSQRSAALEEQMERQAFYWLQCFSLTSKCTVFTKKKTSWWLEKHVVPKPSNINSTWKISLSQVGLQWWARAHKTRDAPTTFWFQHFMMRCTSSTSALSTSCKSTHRWCQPLPLTLCLVAISTAIFYNSFSGSPDCPVLAWWNVDTSNIITRASSSWGGFQRVPV